MRLAAAAICALVVSGFGWGAQAAPKACDRACLEKLAGQYLAALPGHDPSRLPLGRQVRFTENAQPLRLGEGSWQTIEGLGKYRHLFADPQGGQVAAITTVVESGQPAIFDLRLKVEGRRITEVESQIIRDPRGAARYEQLGQPEAMWLQAVPKDQRLSREELIATANKYFTGMQRNDPKGDYSFFDPECNRLEHAVPTTNLKVKEAYGHSNDTDFSSMTCRQQFQTGFLGFVTELRDRRFVVVDEERQAVFAFVDLDHNGTVRVLHMSTGKDFVVPAYFDVPRTLQVGEAFRLRGDKIWRIEMTLTELPYGMRPEWPPLPEPAKAGAAAPKPPCDRDCLSGVLGQVLQAMMDHDPNKAPLAPQVRYTENGQPLTPGDGLWGTASAIAMPGDGLAALGPNSSAYKLMLADPATGQVGYLGAVNENGTPGMLALRARVEGGKVSELEAFLVREEDTGPRGGTVSLFLPRLMTPFNPKGFSQPDPALTGANGRIDRNGLYLAVKRYADALERHSSAGALLAPSCLKRDNGGQTTNNSSAAPIDAKVPAFKPFALSCQAQLDSGYFGWVSKVRDRRIWVADEAHGLVLAVFMVDHTGQVHTLKTAAGDVALPASMITPSTDMVVAVVKAADGRIARMETLQRAVPYGMRAGWQ